MKYKPQYPIYIISKGRFANCLTAKFFLKDNVEFNLVVEPQEADEYIKRFGQHRVLILPFSNLGQGSIPARNWCWEHSIKNGYEKHWIFDDNIRKICRRFKARRIPCNARIALKITEDFINRYENIGIAGLTYNMFVPDNTKIPPFYLNVHVYSAILILNNLPFRWRGRYNEDTDLCLQALSRKYCTLLMNAFSVDKLATLTMKGGNMETLYKGDGRLKMARSLERLWPNVASVGRRYGRPQHVIRDAWRKFDTKLILKKEYENVEFKNDYLMQISEIKKIKNPKFKEFIEKHKKDL